MVGVWVKVYFGEEAFERREHAMDVANEDEATVVGRAWEVNWRKGSEECVGMIDAGGCAGHGE